MPTSGSPPVRATNFTGTEPGYSSIAPYCDPQHQPQIGPPHPPPRLHEVLRPGGSVLDLSLSTFQPEDRQGKVIPNEVLRQPAIICPPSTGLVIISLKSDLIPDWAITLEDQTEPITVGDVLERVHNDMKTSLTEEERGPLLCGRDWPLVQACSKRCGLPFMGEGRDLGSEGMTRVDYLGKEVMFAGLVWERDQLKLCVKKRPVKISSRILKILPRSLPLRQ